MNDPTALHHFSNWSGWNWLFSVGGTVTLFAIAAGALAVFAVSSDSYSHDISPEQWASGIGATVASVIGAIVHGTVARHIATSAADRWWLFMPVIFAGALALLGNSARDGRQSVGYTAAGITFAGGIIAAINDALNRMAANIPMSVTGFVTVIFFGGILFFAWMANQNQRSYR